jgi:hypothetical protein
MVSLRRCDALVALVFSNSAVCDAPSVYSKSKVKVYGWWTVRAVTGCSAFVTSSSFSWGNVFFFFLSLSFKFPALAGLMLLVSCVPSGS